MFGKTETSFQRENDIFIPKKQEPHPKSAHNFWFCAQLCFADVKNDKSFLELWVQDLGRSVFGLCIVLFRRDTFPRGEGESPPSADAQKPSILRCQSYSEILYPPRRGIRSFSTPAGSSRLPLWGRGTNTRRKCPRLFAWHSLVVVDEVPLNKNTPAVFDVGIAKLRLILPTWSRLLVTLSEEGVICYDKPPQNNPRRVELTIVALAQLSGKKCSRFLRVWESLSIQPFPVLPVTNKQFFPFGRVHQTPLISLRPASRAWFCSERRKRLFFSAKLRLALRAPSG